MTLQRALPWMLSLAIVAGLGWIVFGPEKATAVRVVTVQRGSIEHLVPSIAAGTLEPRREATVVAKRGGTVLTVAHEAGTQVEIDEVVVKLEDRDARERLDMDRLELTSMQAHLREAGIRREQADREDRRVSELWKDGVFPRQRAEQARAEKQLAAAEMSSLEANVKRAEGALALSARHLEETELRAPIAGVLKWVPVHPGDVLAPNQPVFSVMDARQLEVSVVMDEVDAALLAVDQQARLNVEAYPERIFLGRVAWIAPAVALTERASRGVEIRAELEHPDADLRVGMTVDVDVLVGRSDDTLHVSTRAVTLVDEGPAVYWIPDGASETQLTRVEVGIATFDRTEILSGIPEAATLILDTDQVTDGARVQVAEHVADGNELE